MKQGKRIFLLAIAAALCLALLLPGGAMAGEVSEKTEVQITEFSIVNDSHVTQTTIKAGSRYNLKLAWDASAYGSTLHEGDYFTIDLPDAFKFPTNHSATHFNITDEYGAVIATAVVDSNGDDGGGTVRVTFTDYVEERNHITGTMYMNFTVIKTKVNTGQTNTFSVTIGGNHWELDIPVSEPGVGTPVDPDEVLHKRASNSSSSDEYVQWTARINFAGFTLPNAIIEDSLTVVGETGISQYIRDSFTLEERVFDEYGNKVTTVQTWNASQLGDRLQLHDNDTRFTLDMQDIEGKQYYLKYRSTYSPGLVLNNQMTLVSGEDSWDDSDEY